MSRVTRYEVSNAGKFWTKKEGYGTGKDAFIAAYYFVVLVLCHRNAEDQRELDVNFKHNFQCSGIS